MSIEYDEKGKFFTNVVTKIPVHATVQTTMQLIQGNVYVRKGERLKDELDRDEFFLAMTNAIVTDKDGKTLFEAPFLAVQRAQIIWVRPDQQEPEGN
ncbi:MAG TPA: hypothetical protein VIN60_02415 [Anaerolineales bacterium]